MSRGYFIVFKTEAGWIGLSGSAAGLSRATLPQSSQETAAALLGEDTRTHAFHPVFFNTLVSKFQAYFEGQKTDFPEKIDLSGASDFQRKVWETTRLIAYGETRSYGWVAEQMLRSRSSRAVGQALGRNPLPIIVPCHRVLGNDGRLCGFGGGLEMKQFLLRIEAPKNILQTTDEKTL
jgi:methylated-DNA-[protein]-cysteine S-methyltransferase